MRFISRITALLIAIAPISAHAQEYTWPVGDLISRVQTNLNRAAHGRPSLAPAQGTDDADRLVDVFTALLTDDEQEKRRAREQLDEMQRSLVERLEARMRAEPHENLSRHVMELLPLIDAEMLAPDEVGWRQFVVTAYLALLIKSDNTWFAWRDDLRGAIRLPCPVVSSKGAPLEFSNAGLRGRLGSLTTCPAVSRLGPASRVLLSDAGIKTFVQERRSKHQEGQQSGETDPGIAGFPFLELIEFRKAVRAVEGNWSHGSIGMRIYQGLYERRDALANVPFDDVPISMPDPKIYRTWQYLSIHNHAQIAKVDRWAEAAQDKLTSYYIGRGAVPEVAERAAASGLAGIALGGGCGGNIVPRSFRTLLLDGSTLAEIEAVGASNEWRNPETLQPFRLCSLTAGMDPLAHIALLDIPSFVYLRSLAASLEPQEREALDLVLDIDARNEFGKTPLMTAAQFDRVEAVRWFIANGADVNARTDSEGLNHGRRTPLMYAAASGSLAAIEALLKAGADPYFADTTGRSAVDYLVGSASEEEPPNPVLSDREFEAAYQLLH